MKNLKRWVMLITLASPTLLGVSCSSDFRDAVWSGSLDYVTEMTMTVLGTMVPIGTLLGTAAA